ncbi:Atg8-interacting protein [Thalictrum thalictroides]|uniref:Atg8-interacting protein n=1 Tax=Thalictrum thalictroides TaxID=46969 RepID=A0A7J6UZJ1_THATH|nr:Atg8-interacting protein [Thalictrum thalictroides]
MEDDKEAEETPSRGNDWEVVSLTASAYAAAPGPEVLDSIHDSQGNELSRDDEEVSRAMFMSGHFVFPPKEHENLPLEPMDNEIRVEPEHEVGGLKKSGLILEEGDKSDKIIDENRTVKEMEGPEELHGIQFLDEKMEDLSSHDTDFGADISGSAVRDEDLYSPEPNVSSNSNLDSSSDSVKSPGSIKGKPTKKSGLPCEAWWKRQAASFYAEAKEANAFWSVFVAAALMGLVILGHRWQKDRLQTQQLKLKVNINDEKVNRMMGSLSRFKDVIVGGHRQGSVIRGIASAEL